MPLIHRDGEGAQAVKYKGFLGPRSRFAVLGDRRTMNRTGTWEPRPGNPNLGTNRALVERADV
jgi:hypothetical protein